VRVLDISMMETFNTLTPALSLKGEGVLERRIKLWA
jgi:hypothetical protein